MTCLGSHVTLKYVTVSALSLSTLPNLEFPKKLVYIYGSCPVLPLLMLFCSAWNICCPFACLYSASSLSFEVLAWALQDILIFHFSLFPYESSRKVTFNCNYGHFGVGRDAGSWYIGKNMRLEIKQVSPTSLWVLASQRKGGEGPGGKQRFRRTHA